MSESSEDIGKMDFNKKATANTTKSDKFAKFKAMEEASNLEKREEIDALLFCEAKKMKPVEDQIRGLIYGIDEHGDLNYQTEMISYVNKYEDEIENDEIIDEDELEAKIKANMDNAEETDAFLVKDTADKEDLAAALASLAAASAAMEAGYANAAVKAFKDNEDGIVVACHSYNSKYRRGKKSTDELIVNSIREKGFETDNEEGQLTIIRQTEEAILFINLEDPEFITKAFYEILRETTDGKNNHKSYAGYLAHLDEEEIQRLIDLVLSHLNFDLSPEEIEKLRELIRELLGKILANEEQSIKEIVDLLIAEERERRLNAEREALARQQLDEEHLLEQERIARLTKKRVEDQLADQLGEMSGSIDFVAFDCDKNDCLLVSDLTSSRTEMKAHMTSQGAGEDELEELDDLTEAIDTGIVVVQTFRGSMEIMEIDTPNLRVTVMTHQE